MVGNRAKVVVWISALSRVVLFYFEMNRKEGRINDGTDSAVGRRGVYGRFYAEKLIGVF